MANSISVFKLPVSCNGMHADPASFNQIIEIPINENLPLIPTYVSNLYFRPVSYPKNRTYFPENTHLYFEHKYRVTVRTFDLRAIKRGHHQLMQLLWILPRQEWVAIPSKKLDFDSAGSREVFDGPYKIDDYCADFLKRSYKIPLKKLPTQTVRITSPERLEEIAGK